MPPKESCGCGFGHSKKKCAFGSSADTFFSNNFSNMAPTNACLSAAYGKSVTRFGANVVIDNEGVVRPHKGAMKKSKKPKNKL